MAVSYEVRMILEIEALVRLCTREGMLQRYPELLALLDTTKTELAGLTTADENDFLNEVHARLAV